MKKLLKSQLLSLCLFSTVSNSAYSMVLNRNFEHENLSLDKKLSIIFSTTKTFENGARKLCAWELNLKAVKGLETNQSYYEQLAHALKSAKDLTPFYINEAELNTNYYNIYKNKAFLYGPVRSWVGMLGLIPLNILINSTSSSINMNYYQHFSDYLSYGLYISFMAIDVQYFYSKYLELNDANKYLASEMMSPELHFVTTNGVRKLLKSAIKKTVSSTLAPKDFSQSLSEQSQEACPNASSVIDLFPTQAQNG